MAFAFKNDRCKHVPVNSDSLVNFLNEMEAINQNINANNIRPLPPLLLFIRCSAQWSAAISVIPRLIED